MTAISPLRVFTEENPALQLPNKLEQNPKDFSKNILGLYVFTAGIHTQDFNTSVGQMNTLANEITSAKNQMETWYTQTLEAKDIAVGAAAVLPTGVINDLVVSITDTFSSSKIQRLTCTNYVDVAANHTANAGEHVRANTTGGAFTITCPENPTLNDSFVVENESTANVLSIDGNGKNLQLKETVDSILNLKSLVTLKITYDGTNWRVNAWI